MCSLDEHEVRYVTIMLKIEFQAVLKFLIKEGVSPNIIKKHVDGVYAEA